MPMLRLQLNGSVAAKAQQKLLGTLSATVAEALGKPEAYMMVMLEERTPMLFSGTYDPAAFFELRSIGEITTEQAKQLTRRLCDILQEALEIPPQRVYGNFEGVERAMWGHDGGTFA